MFTFLKAALSNIRQTGSVAESSLHLSKRMTRIIDFKKQLHIVELGAGTGNITAHILKQMNAYSKLTAFEINKTLFNRLQQLQDARLAKINTDVLYMSDYIKDHSVDYIVSGIPLANIHKEEKQQILKCCKRILKPNGFYIQFQYSLHDINLLKQKFRSVSCGFALLNFPPAFVYYAKM